MSPNNKDDGRLAKSADPARADRAMEDRAISQDRTLTDDQRLDMFRSQFVNSALPDLPQIPGYHLIWLTTTNPRDTIHSRMRLGYEPVKPEDVPGFEYATVKSGEWNGMIGVNEMLAFKLRDDLYYRYMKEAHHDAPGREAERLTALIDDLQGQADKMGGRLIEGDGIKEMRKSAPRFQTPVA